MRPRKTYAVYIIGTMFVIPTIRNKKTIHIRFAVSVYTIKQFTAVYANQLTIYNFIAMSSCRNYRSPIHNGRTNCAVRSSRIACRCTSSFYISKSAFTMHVCSTAICFKVRTRETCLKFCINAEFFIRECAENIRFITVNISNFTHINVYFQVVRPEPIGSPICFSRIAVNTNIRIIINYANRKSRDRRCTSLHIATGTSNNDRSRIILHINGIRCRKAIGQYHMVKFPMVTIVQIDNCLYRSDTFNHIGIQIHPIDRPSVKVIQSRICGNKLNCRSIHSRCHFNQSNYHGFIAHVIANFKFNAMNTVGNRYFTNRHSTIGIRYRNFNAIHISLRGSNVQARCICFRCVFCHNRTNAKEIVVCSHGLILFK